MSDDNNSADSAAKQSVAAAKNFVKESISSAASNIVRTFIIPHLPWILAIAIILIVVIGIIMFFISGMGLIFDSLDAFSDSFKEYVEDIWYGTEENVKPYQIIQVADKLESMGYDLFGDGFVTEIYGDNGGKYTEDIKEYREKVGKPINPNNITTDKYGISHDEYGVTNLNSSLLRRYLVSDNYSYTLYNKNSSWDSFFKNIEAADGFILPRSGLVRLVMEKDGKFGTFNGAYNEFSYNGIFNKAIRATMGEGSDTINIDIDTVNNTLNIGTVREGILWWTKSDVLSYSLEGWTGRYGMPLEFLLSMHLACEQPDLVMDILNAFKTHVNVGLHPTTAHFVPGLEISGHITTYGELKALGNEETYLKTFYPNYYKEWLIEQGREEELEDTAEEEENEDDEEGANTEDGAADDTILISHEDDYGIPYWQALAILQEAMKGPDAGYNNTYVNRDATDFDTFIPYIRNVSNHWFRDAYFVLGTDSQFYDSETGTQTVRLIKNDKEFEYTVGERWTLYETDGDGNYVLYLVNPDGSVGDKYLGTQEQAIKENLRVTKRAITQLVAERRKEDADFNAGIGPISDSLWSAYELTSGGTYIDWTVWDPTVRSYPEGLSEDEINEYGLQEKLKYKIDIDNMITQTRDGERAQTNATIKKILTQYTYYSYDGSQDRAYAIAMDRKEDKNANYQHEKNGVIIDGTSEDTRNQDLVGKFLINVESTSAFKFLENMNTLDADQIYRDFKELIVELNYFDKEDLAGNATGVFQWILPDTGNVGWPVREFSKDENEKGTLIHSKVDLKNLYKIYSLSAEGEEQGGGPSSLEEEEDTENENDVAVLTNESNSLMGLMFLEQKEALYATQGKASNKMEGSGSGFGQSTFFDTAQACWDFIVAHGGSISYGGMGGCPFATPSGSHKSKIDCSGYVTWVLYEWGTSEIREHFSSQRATPTLMKENYTDLFGWTEIYLDANQNALSLLQPGDILVRDDGKGGKFGHTAIVKEVNGGQVLGWDCGSKSNWSKQRTEKELSSNFIAGTGNYSRKGKIIRVDEIQKPVEKYKGYEGNTDVVAPFTGEIIEAGKTIAEKTINQETNEKEEVGFIKLKVITKEDIDAINPPRVDVDDISKLSEHEKNYAGLRYFYDEYKAAGVLGMYMYIEGVDIRIVNEAIELRNDSTIKEEGEYRNRYRKHDYIDVIGDNTRKVLKNKEKLKDWTLSVFSCQINGQKRVFVKEGTVLGKTYTDGNLEKDLSEEAKIDANRAVVRPCVAAGYSEEYPEMLFSNGGRPNWDEIENDKKPTGNYIKIILRTAADGQVVENPETDKTSKTTRKKDNVLEDIEDYFELDELRLDDECPMKLQTTDIPKEAWVEGVLAYTRNKECDSIFKSYEAMGQFYDICVQHEMNPDFLFTRAVAETSLQNSNNNYWGWGVSNGESDVHHGTWKETLTKVCDGIVKNYATPGGENYATIISRYQQRKGVGENGGIPRFGYGEPNTVPGVMSVYSWLGDKHIEGDSSKGGKYYLDPKHTEIYTKENYDKLCVKAHKDGPTTVWEQGSYTAHQVRGMLNTAHVIWEKYYPEEFHNELWY